MQNDLFSSGGILEGEICFSNFFYEQKKMLFVCLCTMRQKPSTFKANNVDRNVSIGLCECVSVWIGLLEARGENAKIKRRDGN